MPTVSPPSDGGAEMADVLALAGSLAFFGACMLYARAIDALTGS